MEQQAQANYPGRVIARLLNITERRLQQLAREGIVPKAAHGQYPLAAAIRGYVTYLQNAGVNAEGTIDPEKLDPFKRRAYYQGELDKNKLAMERSEMLTSMDVEQTFGNTFKLVADFLDTLPDILERDCGASAQMVLIIEKRLDGLRDQLWKLIQEKIGGDARRSTKKRK
jgi:hypothetical protein